MVFNNKLKNIVALMLGFIIAIVISETILQIIDFPQQHVSGWQNCRINNPGQCNSMGFRGREISYSPDDFVVVLLGDSEVYKAALPFEQIPERCLERNLQDYRKNVKVFTIADMGYGQDQQYLALKKYFEKYRADLIILMFTARNDIENNMFPTAGKNYTIKPTFWLEDGKLRGPTERWLEPLGPGFKLLLLWQYYFNKSPGEIRQELWENTILPRPYQPLKKYKGKVKYSWQKEWDNNPDLAFKGIDFEMAVIGNQFTPRSELRLYGINLTRNLFFAIQKLSESNNAKFIILKEERPWELQNTSEVTVYYLNGKYYRLSIRQYQENMRDLFDGFEHYRIPLNMEKYSFSDSDLHLNQQAIEKLFHRISRIISEKDYFKEQ
jgi:hypothetical protein